MPVKLKNLLKRFSLAQQFMLASLIILVCGMLIIGWWVGRQIATGVVNQTAATTALYVDSVVAPHLQGLGDTTELTPENTDSLNRLLTTTPFGEQIVAVKIWDAEGRILYSSNPSMIGEVFAVKGGLARAWQGEIASKISDLRKEENVPERERWSHLLETYSPVRESGTENIIAVVEFYQTVDSLQGESFAAQMRSWLVVGAATAFMYLLLAGMVRQGSDTITRQQAELRDKVVRLTELLTQNEELHQRVRRAAARTTALNERFQRRISAELHDGPAQDLSLALLRLDTVLANCVACPLMSEKGRQVSEELNTVQASLQRALEEVRAIAAGLRLPELEGLTLAEVLTRVVRVHERRTETSTSLSLNGLPAQALMPVKITLYRLVQEALSNAYRHGGGAGQQVRVKCTEEQLNITISDQGPGFDWTQAVDGDGRLGLAGMRERVEILGGVFRIETRSGQGTKVVARLPLRPAGEDRE